MRSPLNYLGGKSRLAKRIVEIIPEDHTCYCEPFCGAAWVFFEKEPSKHEVINDADGELVTFWRVVQNHLEEFLRYYKHAIISREMFDLENRKDPTTLTDIQRAARYYYLQRLSFGGQVSKRTFGTATTGPANLNLNTIEDVLLEVHWRLRRVTVEHLDAMECIRRYDRPSTFFYLDPPYWKTHGYAVPWKEDDFVRLRDGLSGIQGRFILSLNDTVEVRAIFSGFTFQKVSTTYSTGNARTMPKGDRAKPKAEVLIHNLNGSCKGRAAPRKNRPTT